MNQAEYEIAARLIDHDEKSDYTGEGDVPDWAVLVLFVVLLPAFLVWAIGVGMADSVRRLCR